jgi:hypothetical protein
MINPINPDNKTLLLTLKATVATEKEMFLRGGPLSLDMIGVNWVAEKLFLAHQETGEISSNHTLEKSNIDVSVIEGEREITIQLR